MMYATAIVGTKESGEFGIRVVGFNVESKEQAIEKAEAYALEYYSADDGWDGRRALLSAVTIGVNDSHVAAVAANWRDEHDESRYHYLGTVMTIIDADSDEQARAVAGEYM